MDHIVPPSVVISIISEVEEASSHSLMYIRLHVSVILSEEVYDTAYIQAIYGNIYTAKLTHK